MPPPYAEEKSNTSLCQALLVDDLLYFTDYIIPFHTAESVLSASDVQVLEENDSSCDRRPRAMAQ